MKVIFTYEDGMVNQGSIRLRVFQIANALSLSIPIETRPLSSCDDVHDALIFLVKPRNYQKIQRIVGANNIIVLDILDTIDSLETPDSRLNKIFGKTTQSLLSEIDGAIFCSDKTRKAYQHRFKHPELCKTIYHHWDGRFVARPQTVLKQVNVAYFGLPRKAHLSDKLSLVDVHPFGSYKEVSERLFSQYNAHYIVKPDEFRHHLEPLTKIAIAAFAKSPVIARQGHEVELLTDDYPYYIEDDSVEAINNTFHKMSETYLNQDWQDALTIMEAIHHRTSLNTTTKDYLRFIHQITDTKQL